MHARRWAILVLLGCLVAGGCRGFQQRQQPCIQPPADTPRELEKVSLPTYRVEPPDILLIDIVRVLPRQPYLITALDALQLDVAGSYPDRPLRGTYSVGADGRLSMGAPYGSVSVAGMTLEQASAAIDKHLRNQLANPQVSLSLVDTAAKQIVAGEHLVGPDGTVNLGSYGNVYVTGMTLPEAKRAIEMHLGRFLQSPEISLDVFAYNSKAYYIITEGAGLGDTVTRLPVTGNETVLDAISLVGGLQSVSSTRIWISRPSPDGTPCLQVLPVNWQAVTKGADTSTNYQILPGDRVFIAHDRMVAFDTWVAKVVTPFERMLGFTLLSTATVQQINRFPDGGQGAGLGLF